MKRLIVFLFLGFAGCNNSLEPAIVSSDEIILVNPDNFDPTRWPMGEYTLQSATLSGDILSLSVRCPGQSSTDFQLVAWNYWLESSPIQAYAMLSFRPDTVNAGATEVTVTFNMTPLKNAYRVAYRTHSGVIRFHVRYLEPSRAELRYEF